MEARNQLGRSVSLRRRWSLDVVSRALVISLSTTALPLLRWEPHVAFTRHQTDLVGWIGLRVGDRSYRLIEHFRSSCGTLERSRYHWYGIPRDALTAAVGWYAGGGEQFYVVLRGSSLVVYHRTNEENGDISPYRILTRIPLPRTTSNQALQPTVLWRCAAMSILISVVSVVAQPRFQSGG
jgi:hypothetical protein